jgi:ABC-type polysaccharide/polyol phosphate export permease
MHNPDSSVPIYDSSHQNSGPVEEFRQVWVYRDFISQLIYRELVVRYKRSVLGIIWTMLNPLAMMVVLSLAFSQVWKTSHSYAAFALSGLIAWNFFAQTTSQAMQKLVWGGDLLRRIYMPPTAFAISAVGTGLINLAISTIPLVIILLFEGIPLNFTILLLPLPVLLLAIYALAVGLLISTIAVYFPDFVEVYNILLMIWIYLSPVIYPEEILTPTLRVWLSILNPIYSLIRLFRLTIYDGRLPTLVELLPAVVIPVIIFMVSWILFTKKSNDFAYRL